jgi:phosphate:Na+ symporter
MISTLSSTIGGLGLFLLGMWLMTDGLRNAAGSLLHTILHSWTKSKLRGLSAGFLLTALVQSSSAVTVATIGFTDAGLLKLKRAVWVIFGSNVGTTVTGWLVALIGFNFKISAFALPMIGIGMVLKMIYQEKKLAHLGLALVGFGLLFLGIDVLKDTFSGLGDTISLSSEQAVSWQDILLFTGIGFFLTAIMQSSSVTLAITLTALSGGVISLLIAGAMVIGSNLGTTSTAVLSALGSGSAAKRVVASHVLFNLITASVALILLVPLLNMIQVGQQLLSDQTLSTTTLALFHTCFNVLGVCLMLPLASPIVNWLEKRFVTLEEDDSRTIYLQQNALSVESLALHSLKKETERLSDYTLTMASDSLNYEAPDNTFSQRLNAVHSRIHQIAKYTTEINQLALSEKTANDLPILLRISRYYDTVAELAVLINSVRNDTSNLPYDIQPHFNQYSQRCIAFLEQCELSVENDDEEQISAPFELLESDYQQLKILLLRRGTEGHIPIHKMEKTLICLSQIRRLTEQAKKAEQHFQLIDFITENKDELEEDKDKKQTQTSPV